jgi:hypothetical protein
VSGRSGNPAGAAAHARRSGVSPVAEAKKRKRGVAAEHATAGRLYPWPCLSHTTPYSPGQRPARGHTPYYKLFNLQPSPGLSCSYLSTVSKTQASSISENRPGHSGSIGRYRPFGAGTTGGPQQTGVLPHASGRNSVSAEWLGRRSLCCRVKRSKRGTHPGGLPQNITHLRNCSMCEQHFFKTCADSDSSGAQPSLGLFGIDKLAAGDDILAIKGIRPLFYKAFRDGYDIESCLLLEYKIAQQFSCPKSIRSCLTLW